MSIHFAEAASFEHRFWLQILGDHVRFINDSLAESEKDSIASEICTQNKKAKKQKQNT